MFLKDTDVLNLKASEVFYLKLFWGLFLLILQPKINLLFIANGFSLRATTLHNAINQLRKQCDGMDIGQMVKDLNLLNDAATLLPQGTSARDILGELTVRALGKA